MAVSSVEIKGLDKLLRRIKKMPQQVSDDVDAECEAAAHEMNAEASANITRLGIVDNGELLAKQQMIPGGPRSYIVQNTAFQAPFQEFGTGFKFESLPEWVDIAAEFKGLSQSHPGIMARPFMQPSFYKVAPLLISRIKQVIRDNLA